MILMKNCIILILAIESSCPLVGRSFVRLDALLVVAIIFECEVVLYILG